jgi:hypothetical protein
LRPRIADPIRGIAAANASCGISAFGNSIAVLEASRHRRTALAEEDMPTVGTRIACLTLCGFAVGAGLKNAVPAWADSITCKYFSQLPDDCAGAEQRRFDKLRGDRYMEVDLYARDALKKIPYVSIYNTTGQNGGDDTRDSAPEAIVDSLDPNKIARQYHALRVTLSPPLTWTIDWLADRVGAVRNFDGLDAAWMGNSQTSGSSLVAHTPPAVLQRAARRLAANKLSPKPPSPGYRPGFVARTSIEGFKRGSEVYLLDDPQGRTWVMVSYTDKNLPGMTVDRLDSLGGVLDLPQGWKFRTARIAKELVLEPKGGSEGRVEDDKGNVFRLTGPGQSNFVP